MDDHHWVFTLTIPNVPSGGPVLIGNGDGAAAFAKVLSMEIVSETEMPHQLRYCAER